MGYEASENPRGSFEVERGSGLNICTCCVLPFPCIGYGQSAGPEGICSFVHLRSGVLSSQVIAEKASTVILF